MTSMTPQELIIEQENALQALRGELRYERDQAKKWKNRNAPSVGEELLLMEEYLGKARAAYTSNPGDTQALHEMRKVAAMAVRAAINGEIVFREGYE